jgi:hypothetical protein
MLRTSPGDWMTGAREIASRSSTPAIAEVAQAALRVLILLHDRLDATASPEPEAAPPPTAQPEPVKPAARRR